MDGGFVGAGTAINVATVVIGSLLGMVVGHRIPERTRSVGTDGLGLVTLLMAGLSALEITSPSLTAALGSGVPVLVVLFSLVVGGMLGSGWRIDDRLEGLAGTVQRLVARRSPALADGPDAGDTHAGRERFVEGWLTASLLFCVGPLTILGSLNLSLIHI